MQQCKLISASGIPTCVTSRALQRCQHRILLQPRPVVCVKASRGQTGPYADASEPPPATTETTAGRPALLRWMPNAAGFNLVIDAWALLYSNIWAVVLLFLAKDAAAFLLHRFAHRVTNHIAESALGIPISSLGNPWWIMMDAKFMEGHIGYQVLVGLFFLLCLPLNILFNTVAISTTAVICSARQMAAAAHAQSSGPAASFTGQGSGKVGLAECRSTTSSMSSIDMLGSDEFTALGGDIGGSSTGSGSRQEGSSSKLKQEAAGSAAAVGMASSRSGYVTFRCSFSSTGDASSSSNTSGKHVGDSDRCTSPVSSRTPSRSRSRSPLQPAAAAPVPWVAAAFQPSSRQMKPLGLRSSIDIIIEAWSKRVRPQLQQLWRVDLLFNCWALPLQAACLAVVPVFWAFPRLLGIQLALPAAVLGGARGKQALEVSRNLMAGFRSTYAWPFVWLIVAARLVDLVRELVLVSIPVRWWTDVIEVPLAGTALFAVARLLLLRVQDLVPLAAYLTLTNAATTASRK